MVSGPGGRVLIIDDQAASLEAMAEALRPLGYDVWQALDGQSGLATARERQPDVILLDIMMPGMDGYEVCRRLKADDETRLVPVVFLTGLDTREARLKGLEAGAADFLNKPFDLVELEVRVRKLVGFRRAIQDLDDAEKMVFAVARSVEARDEGTGDHCDRLSRLAVRLGERLGLATEDLKALRRAGYLHDIGKVGIPDAILLKPGKLDAAEWEVMRSHVDIGVEICSGLRTLRSTLPVIRHHHERQNGSGYPDRLVGEEVPLLARVFQVTDVFDALTNERPYRRPVAVAAALEVIREETSRGCWDREIVEAFAAMLEEPKTQGTAGAPRHLPGVPAPRAQADPGQRPTRLRKVLIADDGRAFRALMAETLRSHGLEVLEAANGSEALSALMAERPDLAVLDGLMPLGSGFEVIERLRAEAPEYRPVLFLVTAVYRSSRFGAEAMRQYGVAEYLEKPLEPENLLRAVGRHFPEFFGLEPGTP